MKIFDLHNISILLVLLGSGFMLLAIIVGMDTYRIIDADIRRKWAIINYLMMFFLLGYGVFLFIQFFNFELFVEFVTGVVFLAGAFFVLIVMQLINKTISKLNNKAQLLEKKHLELQQTSEELIQAKETLENVFNTTIPLCITNTNYEIIQANNSYLAVFGHSSQDRNGSKCFDSRPGAHCNSEKCPLVRIMNGEKEVIYDAIKKMKNGQERCFLVTARPFLDSNDNVIGVLESFLDIDERKLAEDTKAELVEQLQEALDKVNLLRGLMPICASCKKIRDDNGYWNRIDEYIQDHSEVIFSHGLCPECALELYPEVYGDVKEEEVAAE